MSNLIGCITKWECPECGNILKVSQPLWHSSQRKIIEPDGCGCGRQKRFKLIVVEQCSFETKDDDKDKIPETSGQTKEASIEA